MGDLEHHTTVASAQLTDLLKVVILQFPDLLLLGEEGLQALPLLLIELQLLQLLLQGLQVGPVPKGEHESEPASEGSPQRSICVVGTSSFQARLENRRRGPRGRFHALVALRASLFATGRPASLTPFSSRGLGFLICQMRKLGLSHYAASLQKEPQNLLKSRTSHLHML